MKNYYTRLLPILLLLLVNACKTNEPPFYKGDEFVNFEQQEAKVKEEGGVAKLRVNIGGKLNIAPVTVLYTVTANDNAVALYKIKSEGKLTIPGGQGYAEIEFTPTNNALPDGDKIVELKITSVTGGEYIIGFPGPDALNSSISISIVDDDCPLDRKFITGTQVSETCLEVVEDGETPLGPFYNTVDIDSLNGNSKVIVISNVFAVYQGFEGTSLEVFLAPCSKEATVYDHDMSYTDPDTGRTYDVIPSGTGTFDQATRILTLELDFEIVGLGSLGTWKLTYKL